jgi:hypothetical protein
MLAILRTNAMGSPTPARGLPLVSTGRTGSSVACSATRTGARVDLSGFLSKLGASLITMGLVLLAAGRSAL